MAQLKLHVPNISCAHCTGTIERELRALSTVSSVSADPQTREVVVAHSGDEAAIRDKLIEIGFPPT